MFLIKFWSQLNNYTISSDHSFPYLMIMKQGSKNIFPPTIFNMLALTSIVLWLIIPNPMVWTFPYTLLGMIPLILGIVLNLWTDQYLKKYKTTVKPNGIPTVLITDGPFSLSRHPMYLGMMLLLLGEAMMLGSVIMFLMPLLFMMIIQWRFIPMEETMLDQCFADEFKRYKSQVRRWC